MANYNADVDPVFRGVGANLGLEIWCVENLRVVPVPKSSYGKFFSGSTYVVLNTYMLRSGLLQHEIHYWLGKDANEADSSLASDKALELDVALGSLAVQYQEVQGDETEKFLSYFKPCIIPLEGVFSSGQADIDSDTYKISLLTCKGDRVVHVKEVPFTRSSLNHNDVFILDTATKIFMFSGCNSSTQERAKALEVVQYVKENKHSGKCDIATIEDGKFVADPDVGEFWSLFGGYAPIPKDSLLNDQGLPVVVATNLFWITLQGKLNQNASGLLTKEMLNSGKCYMLDCETDVYVWMGRGATITERKTSISAAEEFLRSQGRSHDTKLTLLTEGSETDSFRSYFTDWPRVVEQKLYEEGRGKVAAIFKHQGYDVKELPDDDEEDLVSMDLSGETKVWRADDDNLVSLPLEEPMKFYSGDCYIIQCMYLNSGREENMFYAWLGKNSFTEDRNKAVSLMNNLVTSTKGDPAMAQIVEGSEPQQLFLILKTLIIFKGGKSSRYQTLMAEKDGDDETYNESKTAIFQVQGSSVANMQAIQVDQAASSLNSSYCYILKTETSVYTWIGNLTSVKDHNLLDRMLNLINPTWQAALVREGSEPDHFWTALGGKSEYSKEKKVKEFREDPHLFVISSSRGKKDISANFKVKEIFNFSQDDLTTEDVLILDCHSEVYMWVGRHSSVGSNHEALNLGLKFLEKDVSPGRPRSETPVYVVTEGCEPPFFTCFFKWDPSKANMLGNSFERKLAILKGKTQKLEVTLRSSWKAYSMENGSGDLKRQSSGGNGLRKSLSSVSSISGSNIKSKNLRRFSSPPPIPTNFSAGSPTLDGSATQTPSPSPKSKDSSNPSDENLEVHAYDRLVVLSKNPATDIDITRREAYLCNEEFEDKFGMPKRKFYQLPKWKQNKMKRSLDLF